MYPHDYHDWEGHPFMHNKGESHPYIEPDIYASAHDAALPVISTIGRGPQGKGIYAEWDSDTNTLSIYEDENDELITSVVLESPKVSVTQNTALTPGQESTVTIIVEMGGITHEYPIILPPGEQGSLIFQSGASYNFEQDTNGWIGWVPVSDLMQTIDYEDYQYSSPEPRVNDMAYVYIRNEGKSLTTIIAIDDHVYIEDGPAIKSALCKYVNA